MVDLGSVATGAPQLIRRYSVEAIDTAKLDVAAERLS
jgi:hypothetical protein